jgi:hypothetical protein
MCNLKSLPTGFRMIKNTCGSRIAGGHLFLKGGLMFSRIIIPGRKMSHWYADSSGNKSGFLQCILMQHKVPITISLVSGALGSVIGFCDGRLSNAFQTTV